MKILYTPVDFRSRNYYVILGMLSGLSIMGFVCFVISYIQGHQVFGMSNRIPWGMSIIVTNFLIGLSAGSPLNIFFLPLTPKGALSPIPDFEEAETYGANDLFELSWKQLLDLEACTNCGWCEEYCPSYLSQKPLSPKKMIQDHKTILYERGKTLLWHSSFPLKGGPSLLELLSEETIWSWTFCLACYEHCPVFISAYDKIIELRRYLVLMESRYPIEVREVFKNLEESLSALE